MLVFWILFVFLNRYEFIVFVVLDQIWYVYLLYECGVVWVVEWIIFFCVCIGMCVEEVKYCIVVEEWVWFDCGFLIYFVMVVGRQLIELGLMFVNGQDYLVVVFVFGGVWFF